MDERCIDCPWFDNDKTTCCRKPPRFCEVDASRQTSPRAEAGDSGTTEAGLSPVPAPGRLL